MFINNVQKLKKIGYFMFGIVFIIIFLFALRGGIYVPNSINLGFLYIRLYGLIIALAVLFVVNLIEYHVSDMQKDVIRNGLIWVIVPAIVSARLWHVITDFYLYQNNLIEALKIWNGGLGIFGGIIGGVFGAYIYSRKKKFNSIEILEYSAIFMPIGQAIGRFGNFVNQELFGLPTNLPWGMFIRPENRPQEFIDVEYFHPAFLYESIGSLVLFTILYSIFKKIGVKNNGLFILLYLIGYATIRFMVEFFRTAPKVLIGLSVAQITSLIIVLLGLLLLIYKRGFYSMSFRTQGELQSKRKCPGV